MGARGIAAAALSAVLAVGLVPSVGWSVEEGPDGTAAGVSAGAPDGGPEGSAAFFEGADGAEGPGDAEGPVGTEGSTGVGDAEDPDGAESSAGDESPVEPGVPEGGEAGASGSQDAPEAQVPSEDRPAPDGTPAEGAYFVRSAVDPAFVLDVSGASVASGGNVQLWTANESNAQRFWISFEDGVCRMEAMCSGKSLDVDAGGQESGTNVQQWLSEAGNRNQKWDAVQNEDGTFTFVSCANGLALDVTGGVAADGTNVQTWEANGSAAQRFVLEPTASFEDGVYALVSTVDMGKVVDIPSASRSDGVGTQLWSRNDSTAQKFSVSASEEGGFAVSPLCSGLFLTDVGGAVVQTEDAGEASRWSIAPGVYGVSFVNRATGRALDVDGGVATDGRTVGAYEVNRTRAQGFFGFATDLVSPGVYRIVNASDGRVLDVDGGSFASGANVQVWDDNGSGAQRWRVSVLDGGVIALECAKSNMALDVHNAGGVPGTNVQVWLPGEGNAAQQFKPIPTGDGWFYLQSVCSGLYLDVTGGGGWNGANVQVWTPNESAAQKFRFDQLSYDRSIADVRAGIDSASGSWGVSGFGGYAPSGAVVSQLQSAIDRVRGRGNDVGFVMVDLATGKGVSCNADGSFYSASTVKGPYVAAVCATNPWAIGGWAGTMESTIRWSSNEGYASLRSAFGPSPMWEWCARSGVNAGIASLNYPRYSARELAKLWTSNYEYFTTDPNGGWVGSWYTSSNNSQLYYQLGGWCTVQSKPGWYYESGYYAAANDAGIVWAGNGAYLAAILTDVPGDTSRISDVVWAIEAAHNEMLA